jgi:hypothetical protein
MDATTSVWLSGALRATCSVATSPTAPVRFTTTTGWPSPAVMPWAATRAVVSVLAPGRLLRRATAEETKGTAASSGNRCDAPQPASSMRASAAPAIVREAGGGGMNTR